LKQRLGSVRRDFNRIKGIRLISRDFWMSKKRRRRGKRRKSREKSIGERIEKTIRGTLNQRLRDSRRLHSSSSYSS
jgi:hypothetical protein